MHCIYCGKEIKRISKFCAYCGQSVEVAKKGSRQKSIVFMVTILIVVFFVGSLLIKDIINPTDTEEKDLYPELEKVISAHIPDMKSMLMQNNSESENDEETIQAFADFLHGKGVVVYNGEEHYGYETNGEYYFEDMLKKYSDYWKEAEIKEYCFIYPGNLRQRDMVIRIGSPLATECYVLHYDGGELRIIYDYLESFSHGSGKVNMYGLVYETEGIMSGGNVSCVNLVQEAGNVENVYTYSDAQFNINQIGIFYSSYFNEECKTKIQNAANKYMTLFGGNFDLGIVMEEYVIDGICYHSYKSGKKDIEAEKKFIELCEQEGIVFLSTEKINQIIEEKKSSLGSSVLFKENEPMWYLIE